ncbi:type II secretion system F family protein [Pelagibaculum spongiae]|uniref:Type II secretion system protein F n=1 Tax=Pelagibaculum spongiae TaxID=2080658 RepID=A0A2V1H3Q8_9GAMM|nr:type II secretion system F family protein [Pelagibaculum spongiae]PVZ71858.1 type II secretion system protein F [Pelagibaculum spongiae]
MAETIKTFVFSWQGADRKGQASTGEITAPSLAIAKANLRKQGINPKRVRKKPQPLFAARIKPPKTEDIAAFARQLATMMKAGVPLVQSFDICAQGSDKAGMRQLILDIKTDVESGSTFSSALKKHPRQFDDLFCNLIAAGEQSGSLEAMLERIALYKEKSESLKRKIKKAMFYPTAIMLVAMIVTAILLIFVVPQFETLFAGFGADLPAFTKMVIGASRFLQDYWWAALGIIVASSYAFIQTHRSSEAFRAGIDRFLLKIPVIGPILDKGVVARFARTLSTTFAAGVPLIEAMDTVAGACGNLVYQKAIHQIKDEVATGTRLNAAMRERNLFPNLVVQMVAIGEESGALDSMLEKVADIYEEEVDTAVDGLSSLLEPIIMVFLGVVIGGLVVAMYLPIFKLGQVV